MQCRFALVRAKRLGGRGYFFGDTLYKLSLIDAGGSEVRVQFITEFNDYLLSIIYHYIYCSY